MKDNNKQNTHTYTPIEAHQIAGRFFFGLENCSKSNCKQIALAFLQTHKSRIIVIWLEITIRYMHRKSRVCSRSLSLSHTQNRQCHIKGPHRNHTVYLLSEDHMKNQTLTIANAITVWCGFEKCFVHVQIDHYLSLSLTTICTKECGNCPRADWMKSSLFPCSFGFRN